MTLYVFHTLIEFFFFHKRSLKFYFDPKMSNKEIKFEPFLDDECITFHNVFIFMDPGLNTSEIKPVMLSIPKSMRSKSKLSPKSPTSLESVIDKGRLLTTSTLKTQVKTENIENTVPDHDPNKDNQPEAQHIILDPIIQKFVEADPLFWMNPIPAKRVGCFHVLIEQMKNNLSFQLFFDKRQPSIMTATLDQNLVANSLNLTVRDAESYTVNSSYDSTTDTFYASLSEDGKNPTEICAANFLKPHIFDFYIPALKKNKTTGTSFMFPIPFDPSTSTLYAKYKEKSQESIKLQSRLIDDQSEDTSFGGRFINKLPCNFILYHQSNRSKDIISFGQADESGYYLLNISYPMNTIQGFIAAIAAHLSY